MSDGDLRTTERAYLALVRARYAAHAVRTGEPLVVRRPPVELLQGIDRAGEGPVPQRIDAMRAAAVTAASVNPLSAPVGLAEVLSSTPRVWLCGGPAASEDACAWLAHGCAGLGWAYSTLGWPFQPVPVVLEAVAAAEPRDLEQGLVAATAGMLAQAAEPWAAAEGSLAASRLVEVWRRQRRLVLLIKVPAVGNGQGTPWQRAIERWVVRQGNGCPTVLIGDVPAPAYSLVRWFCPVVYAQVQAPSPMDVQSAPDAASADPDARLAALGMAVYSAGPPCAELLMQGLRDFWHEVRAAAAIGLGLLGGMEATPALAMAMGDPVPGVRVAAAAALGQIAAHAATESGCLVHSPAGVLAGGLYAYYADVRAAAALALGAVAALRGQGRTAANTAALLVTLLDDGCAPVRESAAAALGMLGDSALNPLLAALRAQRVRVRSLAAQALGSSSEAALAALAEALDDGAGEVRAAAALALGAVAARTGAGEAAQALVTAVNDGDAEVRRAVAEALGDGGAAGAEAAVHLLGDSDPRVRSAAANALVRLGKEATPSLLVAIRSEDPAVRWLAIHVLGVRAADEGGDDVTEALGAAMADPYSAVRWLAAENLGSIKDKRGLREQPPAVRAVLANALHDRNPLVRGAVRAALE